MEYSELNLKSGDLLTAENMSHIEDGISNVTAAVAQIKNAKIVLRNDSTEAWITENTILLKGEPGIEFDTNGNAKLKIGDGATPWKKLSYVATGSTTEGDTSAPEIDFSNLTWGDLANNDSTEPGTTTEILGLNKLGYGDSVDIAALNSNADIIEAETVALRGTWAATDEKVTVLEGSIEEVRQTATTNSEAIELLKASGGADFSNLTWGALANNAITDKGTITEQLGFNKLGYGDKPDIAAINTNTDITEENILALQENQSNTSSKLEEVSGVVNQLSSDILDTNEQIAANNAAVEELKTTTETTVAELNERTEVVENGIQRVDTLIASLSTETAMDVPRELLDLRIDKEGTEYTTANKRVEAIEYKLDDIQENIADYIDATIPNGLIYEGSQLYLAANGEKISEPVTIIGGSGGGGGGYGSYNITLTSSERFFSVTKDDTVIIKFNYASIDEDGYNDGDGIGLLTVNSVRKNSFTVDQGTTEMNITKYLAVGENIVVLKVTNSEGNSRTLQFTVNVVALSLSTKFADMGRYMGTVAFQYRVTGIGTKKAYFYLDGRLIKEEEITGNDVTKTLNIAQQADGSHFLRGYVEAESNGVTVKSNELNIGLMWYSSETTVPMVMINYSGKEIIQGDALSIPYLVYDPYHEIASVTYNIYKEDGELYLTTQGQVDAAGKVWETQDYPAGQVKFEIVCEDSSASTVVPVIPSTFDSTIIADSLALEFTALNRSNYEENPGHWENNGYEAEFTNFGWTGADGWVTDNNGHAVLRFLPGGEMFVPFQPFATDIRSSGYTIEVELATHNVRDYDTTILASYEGGRGIVINSQNASLTSEQSGVSVQFKEDDRVRLTFIVSQGGRQLIYVYINGILCGVTPYGDTDNFKQPNPVGVTIGAESCGLDLYSMRFYSRAFTILEQLNNFICDRSTIADRIAADKRNDILDLENSQDNEGILLSFDKVKGIIPVMIMECPELPQYKGDKKDDMTCEYIDQLHPEYSFTATGVQFDVQGTSSAAYPIKNFKIKIKNGLTYTASGETADGWLFDKDNSIETKVICLKADYASSEHANNVCLVDFYNDTTPYLMPPQVINPKVRQGVNGKPIMLFWRNTTTGELTCQGCYNMNDDKSNEKTFGFKGTDITSIIPNPRIECWEWKNNNNALCLFQGTDAFDQVKVDKDNKEYPAWQDDLEPRYPDLDDHVYGEHEGELDVIRTAIEWVVSTDVNQATNQSLDTPVKYPHYDTGLSTTFTLDNEAYRLSKFKAEFENYFILDAMLYFYLFTEVFLMIDNRAKNMFLTTFDGQHFFPIPYDMDTAMGINNEGALVFDYNLEDTDILGENTLVFNGQESVLWINVRRCYTTELREMYQALRSNDKKPFSYEAISNKINAHQDAWPEMCWNFDAQIKYLDVYDKGSNNLPMLQGDKQAQRDWWLYNAFKYRDSKYQAGDAAQKYIILRAYNNGEITITPYSHIWARVQYGQAKDTTERATRNQPVVFSSEGIDKINDLETHIFSPDRIIDIGDLSSLQIGYCDIKEANKLQRLILGSREEGYVNTNLTTLTVGANELLREVNVANCTKLGTAETTILDFSGCPCLETLDASNTAILSAQFSNGGRLETVHLPGTITALMLRNQPNITTLDIEGYDNISTIVLENIPSINIEDLVTKAGKLNRVRMVNTEWTATDETSLMATIDKLAACDGLSADGTTTLLKQPVVTGRVNIREISEASLEKINDLFPELIVVVNGIAKFFINYRDYNNTRLYRYIANEGTAAIDPVQTGKIEAPYREDTEDTKAVWIGWSELPESIMKPYNIVAKYACTYRVLFLDDNGNPYEDAIQWVDEGEAAQEPVEAGLIAVPVRAQTAQYRYVWTGWDRDYTNITAPSDFKPLFDSVVREYVVRYYNDLELLQETSIPYGSYSTYLGDLSEIQKMVNGEPSLYYEFIGWDKDPATTAIVADTYFYAQFYFDGYIDASWAEIASAAANGDTSQFGIGGRKYIEYTSSAGTSVVEAEIVGINHDTLASTSSSYNGGATTATFTFILRDLGQDKRFFNETQKNSEGGSTGSTTYCGGGWEHSDVRAWMKTALFDTLPADLRQVIKPVIKYSDAGFYSAALIETTDSIWLPSAEELNCRSTNFVSGQGYAYPVYVDTTSRIKRADENDTAIYWTRTTTTQYQHAIHYIDSNGNLSQRGGQNRSGIAFGFCI